MSQSIKVLAVDDDLINRKLLVGILKKSDIIGDVIEAVNGADAIEELHKDPSIQIVLLDIIMPVMDGIETIKVIRADAKFQHLPIIVLTTDETKKGDAIEFGANEFVLKPVKSSELIDKVKHLINL